VSGLGEETYRRLEKATADLEPPFAIVDLDAFWSNATDMIRRAGDKPIRLASKSLRCRALQQRVLQREGFRGTLSFTLPEALWLTSEGFDDILVAYPTTDRAALRALAVAREEDPDLRVTIMIDSVDHLDLIDSAIGERKAPVRVCLDIDAGWWLLGGRVRIGAKRSPLHSPEQAAALAQAVVSRPGFELVGIMAYEAQIAGVGDSPPGRPFRSMLLRTVQARSSDELRQRRAEIVGAVRDVTPLEFVNAGGTGSLERTAREEAVTEIGAGSGLYGPTLFDAYRNFHPRPAAMFALSVVRRPSQEVATVLGGGYLASGPSGATSFPNRSCPRV